MRDGSTLASARAPHDPPRGRVRGHGPQASGSFPKEAGRLSEKTPAGYPPTAPSGRHPPGARASRPHPLPLPTARSPCDAAAGHPAGGNRIGPAEAEPWRRCRSIRVEEMGEAAGRFVRAGRPRSRGASSHDLVTPREQNRRSIRARSSLKEVHRFGVYWCSLVVRLHFQNDDDRLFFLSKEPPGRAGAGLACNFPGGNPKFLWIEWGMGARWRTHRFPA